MNRLEKIIGELLEEGDRKTEYTQEDLNQLAGYKLYIPYEKAVLTLKVDRVKQNKYGNYIIGEIEEFVGVARKVSYDINTFKHRDKIFFSKEDCERYVSTRKKHTYSTGRKSQALRNSEGLKKHFINSGLGYKAKVVPTRHRNKDSYMVVASNSERTLAIHSGIKVLQGTLHLVTHLDNRIKLDDSMSNAELRKMDLKFGGELHKANETVVKLKRLFNSMNRYETIEWLMRNLEYLEERGEKEIRIHRFSEIKKQYKIRDLENYELGTKVFVRLDEDTLIVTSLNNYF